ncbi:Probable carboxylesterase LipT [Mycobacteroides abscessus]|nr:Probable carboxylesterase LipT [Mycobacteroides abscessus]
MAKKPIRINTVNGTVEGFTRGGVPRHGRFRPGHGNVPIHAPIDTLAPPATIVTGVNY